VIVLEETLTGEEFIARTIQDRKEALPKKFVLIHTGLQPGG